MRIFRTAAALVCLCAASYAQFPVASGGGGGGAAVSPPYEATGTGTSVAITAATHGKGTKPIWVQGSCVVTATGAAIPFTSFSVAANGDVAGAWASSSAYTCRVFAAGSPGPAGAAGATGAAGANGSPGAAATVAVGTVTTGTPGGSASVTNTGTSSAAVLAFTIPRGADGAAGAAGANGAAGADGADGAPGLDAASCTVTFAGETSKTVAVSTCGVGTPTRVECVATSTGAPWSPGGNLLSDPIVIDFGQAFTGSCKVIGATAPGGGSGTVTVVSSGSLTSTALVTGGGTTTLQTPSATSTLDSSGNLSLAGSIRAGVGGSNAGYLELTQGTAATAGTTSVKIQAPASVTSYLMTLPGAAGSGFYLGTNSSGTVTMSQVSDTGTGNVVRATSPTLVTPTLGAATATSVNKVAITAPATSATLTIANGKTLTASNTLTLTGTDSSSVAFGTGGTVTYTVASGTAALGTSAIASGACATAVTATATGAATTDVLTFTPNADITAVTGYAPVTTGGLAIYPYVTTNTANFKLCNPTASSITPGAITLNWRIVR